jgi:hypothetical protein
MSATNEPTIVDNITLPDPAETAPQNRSDDPSQIVEATQAIEPPPSNQEPRNQTGMVIPLIRPLDDDKGEPPPHPKDGEPLPNVWIYDGQAYDLTEFIAKHPGGQFFIGRTKNRDITTIVNIFHPNPAKVKKIIEKYSMNK